MIAPNNEIISFIDKFKELYKSEIETVFTSGCCYWFAYILCTRFSGEMMYDRIANHFMCGFDSKLYDITGDVSDRYNAIRWEDFEDELERGRIIDYCVEFNK